MGPLAVAILHGTWVVRRVLADHKTICKPLLAISHPVIGVLINNYNNGPWIRACIDSVLAQTRPADEIIVYDDGSTDDSISILRSYGDRIRLIEGVHDHSLHGRTCQARAIYAAFSASTADHLHLLDGDDVYFPDRIERYEAAWARAPEAVLIHSPSRQLTVEGVPLADHCWPYKHAHDYWEQTYRLNYCGLYYPTSALAFRRDYLARRLPLSPADTVLLAADTCLTDIAPLFGQVIFLPRAHSYWRERPAGMHLINFCPIMTRMIRRNRYYNRWAQAKGCRFIHLWLNPTFMREWARSVVPLGLRSSLRRLIS